MKLHEAPLQVSHSFTVLSLIFHMLHIELRMFSHLVVVEADAQSSCQCCTQSGGLCHLGAEHW